MPVASKVVKSKREKAKWYAVANATTEFSRQRRKISMSPYPAEIRPNSLFFVSEYLTWRSEAHASAFAESFKRFAEQRGVF
jgi:hypothetical protein